MQFYPHADYKTKNLNCRLPAEIVYGKFYNIFDLSPFGSVVHIGSMENAPSQAWNVSTHFQYVSTLWT